MVIILGNALLYRAMDQQNYGALVITLGSGWQLVLQY